MANSFVDLLQANAKALAGAVVGAVASIVYNTSSEVDGTITNVELPNTQSEWIAFAFAVLMGVVLPYLKRNFPEVNKAVEDLELAKERVRLGKQVQ